MNARPILMIPGPIEVSPSIEAAYSGPVPGHVSAPVIEAFGSSLEKMRTVWGASADSQPFIVAGSGTCSMEMAVTNLVDSTDRVLIINTGFFGDRAADMLQRRGAEVHHVRAEPGECPSREAIEDAIGLVTPTVIWAPHVDTSTGVRVDAKQICEIAHGCDALMIFDGVCATAAERFLMEEWGADVYLTASQKALGLPPGLALLVASPRAMKRRATLRELPPMSMDFLQWLPIMSAYEARKPSYFATPATPLIMALSVAMNELVEEGMESVFSRHQKAADAFRAAWTALGLTLMPQAHLAANTLSAVRYPEGVGPELVGEIKKRGVITAGGLHPDLKLEYFRVGHMGYATTRMDWMLRTVGAIEDALVELGHSAGSGREAFKAAFS